MSSITIGSTSAFDDGNSAPRRRAVRPVLAQHSSVPAIAGVVLCLLLAIAQVALAGYQMGVGNQGIQIAFLKRWADPTLYSSDAMVNETMQLYPSYFFQMLAPLLKFMDVGTLYLLLQIATGFATLSAVYWLSRCIYRTHTAALAAAAVLVGGHLRALAGDTLYSEGFTHTYAALPLAIVALAFAYRRNWVAAFAVAGILFNIHALTAAYVVLMLGAALFADVREMPHKRWLQRSAVAGVVFLLLAFPTLAMMLHQHQFFDAAWVNLMRVRSAEHSFPSTWWKIADPDIPRFTLFLGLFVLSWSFSPVRRMLAGVMAPEENNPHTSDSLDAPMAMEDVRRATRITVLMSLAVLALFAAGYLFSDLWPIPTVIRLQPFRASRLLMVLMIVHIVHGAVAAIRAAVKGNAIGNDGKLLALPLLARMAEMISGVLILMTLAFPWLLPLLPLTLAIAVITALIAGHLSWRQALVCVAVIFVALLAYLQIQFPLPLLSEKLLAAGPGKDPIAVRTLGLLAFASAGIFAGLIAIVKQREMRGAIMGFVVVVGVILSYGIFVRERAEQLSEEFAGMGAKVSGLAAWARNETPVGTLFLAPSGFSNFRVQAERSLVGDWRDGTQLYFCADFGPTWLDRVSAIEPGLTLSEDGRRLITRGDDLDSLSDQELIRLARQYQPTIDLPIAWPKAFIIKVTDPSKPTYIILKTPPADHPRALAAIHKGDSYTAYEPRLISVTTPAPAGVLNPAEWQAMENFMATTVQDNIEKYRKANVTIQVVDADGRPVQQLGIKLDQTKLAFTFGGSLGYMDAGTNLLPAADGDQRPPAAKPIELEKLPEVFNGSMIPFSGKWAFIEPNPGQYRWSDLDKYVDYCTKNDLTMEFHHLTGIRPPWTEEMGGSGGMTGLNFPPINPQMQDLFTKHCLAVLDRYGDKIKYYQVVNEKFMMQYVPAAWKALKTKYPNIQFGLSDCINFWSPSGDRGTRGGDSFQYKGMDAVKWLNDQGIKPDFFSIHGHHPANVWSDPREIYSVIDKVHALGPRVHVSEEYLQLNGSISGPVRTGILTPQLQAEYLQRYFTVCFSHPAVDMVNLWGAMAASGWTNTGLLDEQGKPRPAFDTLKKLFNETWHSHVSEHLDLEGALDTRVFHGKYDLSVTLPDGRTLTTKLVVPEAKEAKFKLKLDAEKGTLEIVP